MAETPPNEESVVPGENTEEEAGDETLLAGKYRTPEELAKAYEELQSKLGERDEYAVLGKQLAEHGATSIDDMEAFINDKDEYRQWKEQKEAEAAEPPPKEEVDAFWNRAVKNPKEEIVSLVKDELAQMIEQRVGPVQQTQQQTQQDMVWNHMRQKPGFAEQEKQFRDWINNTPATPEHLWEIYQSQQEASRLKSEMAQMKAQSRDLADAIQSSEPPEAAQLKLPKARSYEDARKNAEAIRQAGVKYDL